MAKASKREWVEIADSKVRHIWQCPNEDCDAANRNQCVDIPPTFYTDNGTPMCECGEDMVYVRTEIKKGR